MSEPRQRKPEDLDDLALEAVGPAPQRTVHPLPVPPPSRDDIVLPVPPATAAPPQAQKTAMPVRRSDLKVFGLLVAGAVLVSLYLIVSAEPENHGRVSTPTADRVATVDQCFLCATPEVLDRVTRLSVARDAVGIQLLESSGAVRVLDAGTQVRIISHGWATTEIRVESGPHFGASGWIAVEFLRD
jgi:ferric-dicitrate binding protein FerR (iron transport regulator)